ncbi:hypothetical protein ACEPAI_9209 [Sanghuangporus weigelae]
MPLFQYKSLIKAKHADSSLTLRVCHSLHRGKDLASQSGLDGSSSYELKKFLPALIDVFSLSDLILCISVTINEQRLPGESIKQSIMARHLIQMLRNNVSVLGINNVSDAYVDERDGRVKVNVTPERSGPLETSKSQFSLVSICLTYHCKTTQTDNSSVSNSSKLGFNLEVLNQAISNLISNHLTKRYPLIFGPLGEKLGHEKPYFRSIARSVLSMARRSPNDEFQKQVGRYAKILRRRLREYHVRNMNDLQERIEHHMESDGPFSEDLCEEPSDESIICDAMHCLFRLVLRPSVVHCVPVAVDAIDVHNDDLRSRSLPFCLFLDEDEECSDSMEDDDAICSSEFEDATGFRTEANWMFMSGPPVQIGFETDLFSEIQVVRDRSENNFLYAHSVAHSSSENTRFSYSEFENSGWASQGVGSESNVPESSQDCSDLYDADTDSFRNTLLEENSSSMLGSENDLACGNKLCNPSHGLDEHGTLASNSRTDEDGYKKDDFARGAAPDQIHSQVFSSTAGSAIQPASFWVDDADQELGFDYVDFLPPECSGAGKYDLITVPTDQLLYTSRTNLSCNSVLSGPVPMADVPAASIPFAIAIDEDTNNLGLDFAGEAEDGDHSNWGNATRGRTFSSSRTSQEDSHTSGLAPRDVNVASPLKKAGGSDDQVCCLEGTLSSEAFGHPELDGVFDFAMHMDYDDDYDGDLGIEDEDDLKEEIRPAPMLQCSGSSGRTDEVEMEAMFDWEEENENEGWSLIE